jgi:mRNA-degrading endonuclease YafQ of YafQ-DinJ toxin-antitoxin module
MPFEFEFTQRFKTAYDSKTLKQREQIKNALRRLKENPRHPGLHTHLVQGAPGVWECYINSGWRITFEYSAGSIIVLRNNCCHDAVLRKKKGAY